MCAARSIFGCADVPLTNECNAAELSMSHFTWAPCRCCASATMAAATAAALQFAMGLPPSLRASSL
eukprot:7173982-Heterocapsa_arctica.AAC.1